MIEKIKSAIIDFELTYERTPGVVYMSESVFMESAKELGFLVHLQIGKEVTIYGARVEIIPYPDNLLIVGGIRANV